MSETPPKDPGLSRRGLLAAAVGGGALLTALTVGQAVPDLSDTALLSPRDQKVGPQGLPVNTSARAAHVTKDAVDPAWRLTVEGYSSASLTLEDLRSMSLHEVSIPIMCVEGWTANATWRGVRLRDVVDLVDPAARSVRVESLEKGSRYGQSDVDAPHLADPSTLLALELNGETLHIDHGYPVRLIAPNRPGVLQTKWLSRVVVL